MSRSDPPHPSVSRRRCLATAVRAVTVVTALTAARLPVHAAAPRRNLQLEWRWLPGDAAGIATGGASVTTTRSNDARPAAVGQVVLMNGASALIESVRDEPVTVLDVVGIAPDGPIVGLRSVSLSSGQRLAARVDWPGAGRPAVLTLSVESRAAPGTDGAGGARGPAGATAQARLSTTLQVPLDTWTAVATRRDPQAGDAATARPGRRVYATRSAGGAVTLQVRLSVP